MSSDRMLLFGGSFDPVHHGHLIIARQVAEHLGAERVVLVPSANPPHKEGQKLAPAADRLAMCKVAVSKDPQFEVSDWEIKQAGKNYTLHTVRHFLHHLGSGGTVFWLIGMDSLNELTTWHQAGELVNMCTIVTAARPGQTPPPDAKLSSIFTSAQIAGLREHTLDTPRLDISSTAIRARVRAGLSVRYMLPRMVADYIERRGLYKPPQ